MTNFVRPLVRVAFNGGVVRASDLPRHEVGQAVDLDGIGRTVEVVHAVVRFGAVREQISRCVGGFKNFCRRAANRYSSPFW